MPQFLGFDHVDGRVPALADVEPFYDRLMPALGLPRKRYSFVDAHGEWRDASAERYNCAEYFEAADPSRAVAFFGVIESPGMMPSPTRIAFRVPAETLPEWHRRLVELGARNVEFSDDMTAYPAVFFEDPAGTRLEVCARVPNTGGGSA